MKKGEKIYNLMKENRLFGDIIEEAEKRIGIEVFWGDWKHDHLRLDWLIKENFDVKNIDYIITEEDGSDCYSAVHYFYFED